MTGAERFADFALGLGAADVPLSVADAATLHLLDALGCGLAAHARGVACEGRSAMHELGGPAEATVIGMTDRLPAPNAAFANAMLCHGLDFDDTHPDAVSHITTVVGPAAIAAAEARGASGSELVTAFVVGSEIVARLGMAAPRELQERGFHATAIGGIFGATAASARLLGGDVLTLTSALGIAGSLASGILAFLADGTPTKPIHAGWAAHGALVAARLALAGAAGPRSVLEAPAGLFGAFLSRADVDLESQLTDLGSRWETPRSAYKPYPACHLSHGALGAAAQAAAGRTFRADEVERIVVSVPGPIVDAVLEPAADKKRPRSLYEAKFSLQYSTAALLSRGSLTEAEFTEEALGDPDVLGLAAKVSYRICDYASFPRSFPGGVQIATADGDCLEAHVEHQRGGTENPLSAAEVRAKFHANATLALEEPQAEQFSEFVLSLPTQTDLSAGLVTLTTQPPDSHERALGPPAIIG